MNPLWDYAGPIALASVILGGIGGLFALRRKQPSILLGGVILALALTALWHGPGGAADRLTTAIERQSRTTLDDYEMPQVQAHLHRSPLSRRLILTGPADDFQRSELVRIMNQIEGVGRASWEQSGGIPLILEAALLSVLGFLLGLSLAYLVELRRRYNAQWKW